MKKNLTTGDIANYCSVHVRTVIRWIERGKLKAYQLPGRGDNRVRLKDFLVFLETHGMPVPEELQPANRRILIIDDDERVAKAIQRSLRHAQFETLIATSGFEAGALLNSFKPAVMTLDLRMPGMDGFEVLEFVQKSEEFKKLKIIVVSALSRAELDKALARGADAALEKPLDDDCFIETVARLANVELTG
ncbi:MAG: response regulator [Gammaproteobacteria bacterium]|nr:response regulator [Gammaproteobacteria bacterium]